MSSEVPHRLAVPRPVLAFALALLLVPPVAADAPGGGAPADGNAFPDDAARAGSTDLLDAVLRIPGLSPDERAVALLDTFQMRSGPGMARYLLPPATVYHGVDPVCDLDGDGNDDLVANEMTLRRNGRFDSGFSYIRALSGANGTQLWSADNLVYFNMGLAGAYGGYRGGQSNPQKPPNVEPLPDVDGDGVCDLFAYGFATQDLLTPFLLGTPSVSYYDVTVRVLSGKDGSSIWSTVVSAANIDYSMPLFGWWSGNLIVGFPTGFALYDSPQGKRFVLKTTDFAYSYAADPLGVTTTVTGADPTYVTNLLTAEHVLVGNVTDGSTVWQRDFGADLACALAPPSDPPAVEPGCATGAVPAPDDLEPGQPDNVNITWLSGAGDLDGDGEPDLVLDQLILTNPHTSKTNNPLTGEEMFEYGRGMRMLALAGTDGSDLWATTLIDPLAVQAPPPNEDNLEILAWTLGRVLPDADGDGRAEPIAQYLTEEMVGGTPNGRHRTHFLRLSPEGTPLWDHPQQGWGHITALSADRMAAATLDLPTGLAQAKGRFPEKALRIAGLDASTGAAEWSYEEPFGQDSQSAYEIGLQQIEHTLAPLDVDRDGRLDVVTPSRYTQPDGHDQVFIATARQSFQVLAGSDGGLLSSLPMWGSNGLLLPCVEGDTLTFAVGHARRMDLVRIDAATAAEVDRTSVFNFVEERSGLVGIDMMSLDGGCTLKQGRLFYALNLEAYSFYRRYEIIPLIGVLGPAGQAVWRNPHMEQEPPTPSLLETFSTAPSLIAPGAPFVAALAIAIVAGLALGALLGLPAGRALAARRRRLDPLGLALMVLLVPPMAFQAGSDGGTDQAAESALAADAVAALGDMPAQPAGSGAWEVPAQADHALPDGWRDAWPKADVAVRSWSEAQMRGGRTPDVSDRYDENETITYPHVLGDMDGDGVDDVAMDVYCTGTSSCYDPYHTIYQPVEYAQDSIRPSKCGPGHVLTVVSGARGDRLWDAPLDRPLSVTQGGAYGGCGAEAVVGLVPLPDDGTGILIYRFEAVDGDFGMYGQLYNHTLFLRDGQSGAVKWAFNERGYMTPTYINTYAYTATSALLNPMLVHPEADRTANRMGNAGEGLFVQGIGFRVAKADTQVDPTYMLDRPPRLSDEYRPVEWLASLDPVTGAILWRVDSFTPTAERSVLPLPPLQSPFRAELGYNGEETYATYSYPFDIPYAVPTNAWADGFCCGDLDADGVFDPVFTTLEWAATPNGNNGPFELDAKVVAFNGATGTRLYENLLIKDHPLQQQRTPYWEFPYDSLSLRLQGVGDATGDGAADLMVHRRTNFVDFETAAILLDGPTGDQVWQLEVPRAQSALALGDATGDGGTDLLFIDWYEFEAYRQTQGDFTNATQNLMRMRSGADGTLVYETSTYNAAADVVREFSILAKGGLPDLDEDGVGDFVVDDPVYLPDQVVLHQMRFLSGRDGTHLYTIPVAGSLAFVATLPDLDGDGIPELAVLSGDANDLWLSYRDGRDGSALWGHRAFTVRTADYVLAIPNMEFLAMDTGFGKHDTGFLANLHMETEEVIGEYETIYITVGGPSGSVRELLLDSTTVPQIVAVLDADGASTWSYPSGGDVDASRVDGELPGTAGVLAVRAIAEPTTAQLATRFVHDARIPLVAFGVCLVASFLAMALLGRAKGAAA